MTLPALFTVPQAAEYLRLHRSTVYRMVADGELEVVNVRGRVRITADHLAAYVAARTEPAYRRAN